MILKLILKLIVLMFIVIITSIMPIDEILTMNGLWYIFTIIIFAISFTLILFLILFLFKTIK